MLIRDIMNDNPVHVSPRSTLSMVVALMVEKNIGFMVVSENGRAVGVLTEGDLVSLAARGIDMTSAQAREYMHSPVFTVQMDASVFHAYDAMVLRKIRHLVVSDHNGLLAGVVTMSNFIANLAIGHFSELQRVTDILHPVKVTVTTQTPLVEVIRLMDQYKHAMVAIDEGGQAVGILTSRGVARLWHMTQGEMTETKMADVMRPVHTIHYREFVPEASTLMKQYRTRHLIVVGDQGQYQGLLTISDVAHSVEGRYVEFMRSLMRDAEAGFPAAGEQDNALFERNPNAVFFFDLDGKICHINPACILLTGYASEALQGKSLELLCAADSYSSALRAFSSARAGEAQSVQVQLCGNGGEPVYTFMSFVPVVSGGVVDGIYAVAFDITERILYENRLYRYSQALQQANEAIVIADHAGVIEFANRRMHQLFGCYDGELSGRCVFDFEYLQGEESTYRAHVWPAITNGMPYKGEFLHQDVQGRRLALEVSCAPVCLPDSGHPVFFTIIYEDMSDKQARTAQMLHAQRMETVSILAAGVAHNFNNYLGAFSASVYMIRQQLSDRPEVVERLDKLQKLTNGAAALVDQLLTFSRKDRTPPEVFSWSQLVAETRGLARVFIPRNVAQHWDVDEGICMYGSAGQIQQLLLNLLKNACDAVRNAENPEIRVCLKTVMLEDEQLLRRRKALGEDYVMLMVKDNGCGIDEHDRKFIFDPFFTTKGEDEGTGLGLSMVYAAAQAHHGWVDVCSEPGEGCEFRLYFPKIQRGIEPAYADVGNMVIK